MPTETQRNSDHKINQKANAALIKWQAEHWEMSIEEKAAFLTGYIAAIDDKEAVRP